MIWLPGWMPPSILPNSESKSVGSAVVPNLQVLVETGTPPKFPESFITGVAIAADLMMLKIIYQKTYQPEKGTKGVFNGGYIL